MGLTFLVGGARSGKSSLAVELARVAGRDVVFVATAEPRDEEMAARIERHRADRPGEWDVVEAAIELEDGLGGVPEDALALVDCLTLWVSNLMEIELDDEEIERRAEVAAEIAAARGGGTIAVSNDVGLGIVPAHPLSRRFRDVLGHVNMTWAARSDRSFFVAAGRVLPLQEPGILWEWTP